MASSQLLSKFHLIGLFLCTVLKYQPKESYSNVRHLTQQCQYDTVSLCPECFLSPVNCSYFEYSITIDESDLLGKIIHHIDSHGVRYGILNDSGKRIVIKNLNQNGAVQALRDSICNEFGITDAEICQLRNEKRYLRALRKSVLDENLIEGAIFCPQTDERALERFLDKIDGNDLLKILLMKVNAQPLLLKMLQDQGFPVPNFVYQGGFILVETYEGEPLAHFYDSSLTVRLMIANELIKASLKFTTGVNDFRFYLTDLSPDNIVVQMDSEKEIKVSFVDLNNLIILDSRSPKLSSQKHNHTHTQIECDGCFAYVQEDLCSYRISDINLFAVCQLLLENLNGDSNRGFLHSLQDDAEQTSLRTLLHNCVYCQPPYCEDRQGVLQRIQTIIYKIVYI